jgi:uncharacterized membrane protein YjgN (DUF898 family)
MTDISVFQTANEGESQQTHPLPFSFSGTGSEYFRIWIVNLLLSIVTLGIYSAWAKVRRLKYFYGNTTVANSSFEYHGNPIAILKGRFVAATLIIAYNLALKSSGIVALIMIIAVAFSMPWLVWKSLQFKLYNSSYRGIRFSFRGSLKQAYLVYLLWPLLSGITLLLAAPLAHQRLKRFQHQESRFGSTHFSFDATVGAFYKRYLMFFAIWIAGFAVICVLFGGAMFAAVAGGGGMPDTAAAFAIFAFVFALYVWMFLVFPIFATLIQNLIWNNTRLGLHHFQSNMKWSRVSFIAITNIIGVICTLGLYMPFAQIRYMKYRVESMSLLPDGSLDHFVAATQAQTSATGEGISDLLDFDLSL